MADRISDILQRLKADPRFSHVVGGEGFIHAEMHGEGQRELRDYEFLQVPEGYQDTVIIDDYLDAALIGRTAPPSDRMLAKVLGVSPSTVNHWRRRKAWPSDEIMIRLADYVGADSDQALLRLNAWRSTDPYIKKVYLWLCDIMETYKGPDREDWLDVFDKIQVTRSKGNNPLGTIILALAFTALLPTNAWAGVAATYTEHFHIELLLSVYYGKLY